MPGTAGRSALSAALSAGPSAGATLNLLQEALQELGNPARVVAAPKDARSARRYLPHQHAATANPRRASGRPAHRGADRSLPMRRSRPPRIICSTTPMPPLHGKPCCR